MRIGYDFKKGEIIKEEGKAHVKTEDEAIAIIMDDLGVVDYRIDKNSDDYSTLVYKDRDLFRIKYTNRARWIRILMFPKFRSEYENGELFKAQANKNQIFWKSDIKSLFDYKKVLTDMIIEIDNQ